MYIKLNFKLIVIYMCSYVYKNCFSGWYLSMKCFYSKSYLFVFFANACVCEYQTEKHILPGRRKNTQTDVQQTHSTPQQKTNKKRCIANAFSPSKQTCTGNTFNPSKQTYTANTFNPSKQTCTANTFNP